MANNSLGSRIFTRQYINDLTDGNESYWLYDPAKYNMKECPTRLEVSTLIDEQEAEEPSGYKLIHPEESGDRLLDETDLTWNAPLSDVTIYLYDYIYRKSTDWDENWFRLEEFEGIIFPWQTFGEILKDTAYTIKWKGKVEDNNIITVVGQVTMSDTPEEGYTYWTSEFTEERRGPYVYDNQYDKKYNMKFTAEFIPRELSTMQQNQQCKIGIDFGSIRYSAEKHIENDTSVNISCYIYDANYQNKNLYIALNNIHGIRVMDDFKPTVEWYGIFKATKYIASTTSPSSVVTHTNRIPDSDKTIGAGGWSYTQPSGENPYWEDAGQNKYKLIYSDSKVTFSKYNQGATTRHDDYIICTAGSTATVQYEIYITNKD